MIEKYEELVSALYLSCRDSSLGKVSDLKTECELLGLKVAEEELLLIQKVCLDSADVASALEKIKDITDRGTPEKFGEILKVVETDMRIREEQEERGRAETSKSKKMIEKEIKTKKKDFLELAQKANFHEHITDFKILRGKSSFVLERQVTVGLRNGWKPFGNLAVYHPGGNPLGPAPDYFFQTVVKFKYE